MAAIGSSSFLLKFISDREGEIFNEKEFVLLFCHRFGAIYFLGVIGCGSSDSPSGPRYFAYVTNRGSNNVSAYFISPTTGALTEIVGSPFNAGDGVNGVISVTVDPTGKFLYVANNISNNVSAFSIDPTTGVLTHIANYVAGIGPTSIVTIGITTL